MKIEVLPGAYLVVNGVTVPFELFEVLASEAEPTTLWRVDKLPDGSVSMRRVGVVRPVGWPEGIVQ